MINTLDLFRNEKKIQSYASGDIIFEQGQPAESMFVLRRGDVDLEVDGNKVLEIHEGDILGEMALIDNSSRSATARAATDCELIAIDESRFKFLVQQTPFFSLHVMRILVERLRKMNSLVDESHNMNNMMP